MGFPPGPPLFESIHVCKQHQSELASVPSIGGGAGGGGGRVQTGATGIVDVLH